MNKRTRLVILIAVLAICFVFLWPTISWYGRTPKEVQQLALGSTENIKTYAENKAADDVRTIKDLAKKDSSTVLADDLEQFAWLNKAAAKKYKSFGEKKSASKMTVADVLGAYNSELEFMNVIKAKYRDEILKAKKYYDNSVKLGLDLSGGMNVIVRADLDAALEAQGDSVADTDVGAFKKEAMENAIENLTSRIDRFGLTSPVIRQQGEDRIYIEIPGAAQADAINTLIMGKGILNFRLSDMEATAAFQTYYAQHPASTFNAVGELMDPSVIPDDCEVFGVYTKDEYGLDERYDWLVVKKEVALDGKHIQSAEVRADQFTGQPQVCFNLDLEGTTIFGDFTAQHIGDYLAIVSDNKVKSNARIQDAINTGSVSLSGSFSQDEANNIKKVLQTAWLNVPLTVESQQVIGASLGEAAIKQGVMAIILGLSLILVFMLIFYKASGINAVVAQILNLYIMFAVLSAFNLTLTLSSIAGMILTIGMAVDANVLIFERIKEELRAGKTRAAAVQMGFDNAFWAIMDSNITTFIAAIFLSQLGSGSIQGFAVSLAIGVVSSVFTALFVSRLIFDFDTDVLHAKKVSIGWGIK
ncbi:MAG: protein translocase subunit SecD [Treponema sp.]|nr:protein translocase subunit SecD [Treponema sp.]